MKQEVNKMEREIKFRAWDNSNKKFVDPILTNVNLSHLFELNFYDYQQFTGLKDKNGVDIYEGDKVLVNYNYIGVIVPKLYKGKFMPFDYDLKRCEVIGNIHENPELL